MTDPIIDAIDHCLADYTISLDAMRWTPESDHPQPWEPEDTSAIIRRYRMALLAMLPPVNDPMSIITVTSVT